MQTEFLLCQLVSSVMKSIYRERKKSMMRRDAFFMIPAAVAPRRALLDADLP